MSPGCFTRRTRSQSALASASQCSLRKATPADSGLAVQLRGTPLEGGPTDKPRTRGGEHEWPPCLLLAESRAPRPQPRPGQYVEGLLQSADAEVQYVVVGE